MVGAVGQDDDGQGVVGKTLDGGAEADGAVGEFEGFLFCAKRSVWDRRMRLLVVSVVDWRLRTGSS